jgi:AI-2 transport protein TqsA
MTSASSRDRGFSPASRVLLSLAAATVTIAGLYLARGVIGPLAIAALVVMVAHPLRQPLLRRGAPSALATAAVVAVSYLILIIMGTLLIVAVAQLVALLPQYADQLAAIEDQLVQQVSQLGLDVTALIEIPRLCSSKFPTRRRCSA